MRRPYGEGSWGTKNINGIEYQRYRKIYYGKTKDFYGKTRKEVQAKVKKFESSLIGLNDDKSINKMTFYSYCTKWLFEWKEKPIKAKTVDYYDGIIENKIKDSEIGCMQIKPLNNLDPIAVGNLFNSFVKSEAKKSSRSYVNGLHTLLNQVCVYGFKHGHFTSNFMINVPKVSEVDAGHKKIEKTALEYDSVLKLWDEMLRKNTSECRINGKDGSYVYGILSYAVLFSCYTGLRYGELIRLTWSDIDEEKCLVFINKQFVTVKNRDAKEGEKHYITLNMSTKSQKSNRVIPLSDQCIEILSMIKERFPNTYKPEHLIFSVTDKPASNSSFNRLLRNMCKRCGIQSVTPHELRHSFGSILINEDEQNLYAVSDMLGHSSTDVTYKKYIHIFEKKKAEAISIFNNMDKK